MANKGAAAKKTTGAATDATLAVNRRASFDYEILERYEAGLALVGSEVKSVRDGRISLAEAWVQIERDEAWLVGAHIAEYELAHRRNHEPMRRRKLLLHRREIDKLFESVQRAGLTLIPLRIYLKGRRIKLELGLCRGKQAHDKREKVREREHKREVERALRERR
ncbi:MAG: SsrA-binding protein SmpB [Nannocystaceae bacterium]